LPTETVSTYFGDITVPVVSIDEQIFSGEPFTTHTFGILPDSINPGGISVLGTDILDTYSAFDIDTVNMTFSATAEPVTLMLSGIGAIAVVWAGVHRERRRRQNKSSVAFRASGDS
jgi:hypothetical protein